MERDASEHDEGPLVTVDGAPIRAGRQPHAQILRHGDELGVARVAVSRARDLLADREVPDRRSDFDDLARAAVAQRQRLVESLHGFTKDLEETFSLGLLERQRQKVGTRHGLAEQGFLSHLDHQFLGARADERDHVANQHFTAPTAGSGGLDHLHRSGLELLDDLFHELPGVRTVVFIFGNSNASALGPVEAGSAARIIVAALARGELPGWRGHPE